MDIGRVLLFWLCAGAPPPAPASARSSLAPIDRGDYLLRRLSVSSRSVPVSRPNRRTASAPRQTV